MTPYAMVPQMLPTAEELLRGFVPAPAPMPGSLMAPPGGGVAGEMTYPGQMPDPMARLRALGAGMMTPHGGAPPPLSRLEMADDTMGGTNLTPTIMTGADLGAAAADDPAGAEIGRMVGLGPAFRGLGAIGSGIMSIPGVRAGVEGLGRTLARPAVGVPLALGGSLAATTGEAQAPTAQPLGPRTREAQTALEAARKRLTDLEAERSRLQGLAERFDPDKFDWTSGTPQERQARIKAAQEAIGTTPDGQSGPNTRAALAAYRRRQLDQIEALTPRETTARADIKTAEDRRATSERLDLADAGRKALDESQPGWLEQWGPTAGAYVGGGIGGHIFRNWLARGTTQRAAAQKASVDAVSAQLGQGDLPTRIGRLNELWTNGSPPTPFSRGTAPPFAFTPSGSPNLHTPSPVAPWSSVTHEVAPGMMGGNMTRTVQSADQLYRPSLGTLYGPTAATMGIGGAESAGAQFLMLPRAQQALQEAQAAMDRTGPTPENVAQLRSAQREVAFWTGMQNAGRGMALGGLGAEMTHPLRNLPRPSMAAAEAERGALDLALHPRAPLAPPVPPGPPPPAPVWDARVGRWRLNGGFVAAPLGGPRRGGP